MSSEVDFFDILYLGVFAILSPAFDSRFYGCEKPPLHLVAEINHAISHFYSLLHVFCLRFIILLDGQPVAVSYVVDRLLAEFAAATVLFKKEGTGKGEGKIGIVARLEAIIQTSHPKIFSYYSSCLESRHSHFIWTGPNPQILPRSRDVSSIMSISANGELLDNPSHPIYVIELEPTPPPSPAAISLCGKRPIPEDGEGLAEWESKKRQKLS